MPARADADSGAAETSINDQRGRTVGVARHDSYELGALRMHLKSPDERRAVDLNARLAVMSALLVEPARVRRSNARGLRKLRDLH